MNNSLDSEQQEAKDSLPLDVQILLFIERRAEEAQTIERFMDDPEKLERRTNTCYPATTREIAKAFGMPSATASDLLENLRRRKKIKSRLFQWFYTEKRFYIPYSMQWSSYLFQKCRNCENWNRFIRNCTFHEELAEAGLPADPTRVNQPITPQLMACKWWIKRIRKARKTFKSIQAFAQKTRKKDLWWDDETVNKYFLRKGSAPLWAYQCYYCEEIMPAFDWGFLPKLGSAIVSCPRCGSFYKVLFNKDEGRYFVITSEEKMDVYRRNYRLLSKGEEATPNYCSEKYGISVYNFDKERDLHDEVETFCSHNLSTNYNLLDFIVAHSEEDYQIFTNHFKKHYPQISILLAEEPLSSVQPTEQQKGVVKLLRETGVGNPAFSTSLLWSRINVLEELDDLLPRQKNSEAQEFIFQKVLEVQRTAKEREKITSKKWNAVDRDAANKMWAVIKPLMDKLGFDMPNRSRARHTEHDPFHPYGKYFSYSKGNTVINGVFLKLSDHYKERCNKYQLPWKGLEGICHKKTWGGKIALLLDLEESFKQATIPKTIKALYDGALQPEEIARERLRKRILVYYLKPGSKADDVLDDIMDDILNQSVRYPVKGKEESMSLKKAIDYSITGFKGLLDYLINESNYPVKHQEQIYYPWALITEKGWEELAEALQEELTEKMRTAMEEVKDYYRPYQFKTEKHGGDWQLPLQKKKKKKK
ncbi:MAG: hypothetical protein GF308_18060 [Candidatus Heimdallarchaeota archaeon]|nr:hypothetical protein [Candidatus Heimdallarchaeota archaeon]